MYIYIYIYRERERERERWSSMYYIYIYTYIHTCIHRYTYVTQKVIPTPVFWISAGGRKHRKNNE